MTAVFAVSAGGHAVEVVPVPPDGAGGFNIRCSCGLSVDSVANIGAAADAAFEHTLTPVRDLAQRFALLMPDVKPGHLEGGTHE